MRTAVCEDDENAGKLLEHCLARYAQENNLEIENRLFSSAEELLRAVSAGEEFTLLFLDIYMPGLSGMACARRLRDEGCNAEIVFTTSSTEFAVEGYAVAAVGYLVKPYTYAQFDTAMKAARHRLGGEGKTLRVMVDRLERHIAYGDILYVETEGRYAVIQTRTERIACRMSMHEMEAALCTEPCFCRCHRGCIVNFNFIETPAAEYILMKNGQRVPISIKDSLRIRQRIADYFCSLMLKEG